MTSRNSTPYNIWARLFAWLFLAGIIALYLWPLTLLQAQEAVPVIAAPAEPTVSPQIMFALAVLGAIRIVMKAYNTYRNGYVVSTPITGMDGEKKLVPAPGWLSFVVWLLDAVVSVRPPWLSVASDGATIAALHPEIPAEKPSGGGNATAPLALLVFLAVSFLGSGCLGYRHARYSDNGELLEETRLRTPFLTKTTIEGLKTSTKQTRSTNGASSYVRTVGVSSADSQTDAAGIQAMESLLGRAILTGLNAAAPAPIPKP